MDVSKRERSPGHWEIKIYVGQAAGKEQYEYFTFIGGRREADAEEARLKAKYGKAPAASRAAARAVSTRLITSVTSRFSESPSFR